MHSQIADTVRAAAGELVSRLESAPPDAPAIAAAIDECLARLAGLGLIGPANQLPSSELWNHAGFLLERGWLQNRARTKPRGYAGDHELLAWIYHRRTCEDPLGKLFDEYFQAQAAPQAVRNRMAMMRDWIVEALAERQSRPLHVAVVGSAAGWEIDAALQHRTLANIQVTLLDVDPAAIEYARALLSPRLSPERLAASSVNLFRLPDRPQLGAALRGADLILCPGLFDYLDDEAAGRMLRALYDQVAPRGRLIVFQFVPHNPTRAYMEWFGNWYLVYRTRQQLQRLVLNSGCGAAAVDFGAEPLGIDLLVSLTKP